MTSASTHPDSQEGLALALREEPDAILLDLMMPTYSGLEVCQTLSSLSFTAADPGFSSFPGRESAARYEDFCVNLGAKGFFQKPVNFDKLRMELAEAVESRHDARQEEVRVRLQGRFKTSWSRLQGKLSFDLITVTQNLTASGFLCGCQVDVKEGAVVEVYLAANRDQFVGRAEVVHVHRPGRAKAKPATSNSSMSPPIGFCQDKGRCSCATDLATL